MADNKSASSKSMEVYSDCGQYGFSVCAGKGAGDRGKTIPKNINYTFSETLKSLFVKRGEKCPFEIGTTVPPPPGSKIKVNVYSQTPEKGPVMLCPNHAQSEINDMCPLHFARSENNNATYVCCEETGELSILFPFKGTTNGMMDIQNLRFLCYSSCLKDKNNSYFYLKFSLVDSQTVLGYHMLKLHVCSTPGRTREGHEQANLSGKRKALPNKKRPTVSDVFQLQLNTREKYNILKRLNRLFDLEAAIPLEVQEKYLKRYRTRMEGTHTVTSPSTSPSTSSSTTSSSTDTQNDVRYTYRRILKRRRAHPQM